MSKENQVTCPQATAANNIVLQSDMFEKFRDGINTDMVVELEDQKIRCHEAVFLLVSRKLRKQPNLSAMELIPENCTPGAFNYFYRWILGENSKVDLYDILHVLRIARSFEIDTLIEQFWMSMDNRQHYSEDTAFLLYMEARRLGMWAEASFFLKRVQKYFLCLVASPDFLELELEAVLQLLTSNYICVHSEIEVFFAAIRWLNKEWPKRYKHHRKVLGTVRFGLMSKHFLLALSLRCKSHKIECYLGRSEIQKMVYEGMVYNRLYRHMKSAKELEELFTSCQLRWPKRYRTLVVDDMTANWIRSAQESLREINVMYQEFLQLLREITRMGPVFMANMRMLKPE